MSRTRRVALWISCLAAGSLITLARGAGADEESPPPAGGDTRYVELQPTFVTNYGYSDTGRLKFLKADVTVRVASQAAEMAVRYHLPYLRNNLVLLFSRQDESAVVTPEGREQMRRTALAELREILSQEEGQPYIDDLVFNNFVVQR